MHQAPPGKSGPLSRLETFAGTTLGLTEVTLERLTGGASRGTFMVRDGEGGQAIACLRVDEGAGGLSDTSYTLSREGELLRRMAHAGLPVPAIMAELQSPPALLMEAVPGQARLTEAEADLVGPEYMRLLARVHSLAPGSVLPDADVPGLQALDADLDWWEALGRRSDTDEDSLIWLGLSVLRECIPRYAEDVVFLHGDAGAGNFLVEDGRVTGLLDWEMAHAGDFHEDLAWVSLRTVFTPFGSLSARMAEYEAASGRRVDPHRLTCYQALVTWKCLVAVNAATHRAGGRPTQLSQLIRLTYEPVLADLLVRVVRQRREEEAGDGRAPEADSDSPTSEATLEQLAQLSVRATETVERMPAAARALRRARTKGLLA